MAVVTLGSLTDFERTKYFTEGLPFAKPALIHEQYGQKDRIEARQGKVAQWFRMTKLGLTSGSDFTGAANYVTNATGAPPTFTPETPAETTVTATMAAYFGKGYEWNEAIDYVSLADLPKELRSVLFQQAAEVVDTVVRNTINVGTTVSFANGRASRPLLQPTDYVDMNDFIDAAVVLRANDAPRYDGDMYAVIHSPYVTAELMKDSVFQAAIQVQKKYNWTGVIAELFGMRFHETSRASTTTSGGSASQISTLDQTLVIGKGAYGVTKWMMNDFDIIYTGPGGWGDEYKTRHALTWKHYMAAVILNQSNLLRLESARRA